MPPVRPQSIAIPARRSARPETRLYSVAVCLAVVCGLALLISGALHAQRFRGGCSWDGQSQSAADRASYWTDPLTHNKPYDGRLMIARIWYAGYFANCAASAPYFNELSVGWAHDFPHPEENLAKMINGLSTARAYNGANILRFDDPSTESSQFERRSRLCCRTTSCASEVRLTS